MSHYAEVDETNTVIRVLVVPDEQENRGHQYLAEELGLGGTWIQTSYNTRGNVHYGPDGQPDAGAPLHMNYAGIGYTWDGTGFAAPQPYPSWTLGDDYQWHPPEQYPGDGNLYTWDEASEQWVAE